MSRISVVIQGKQYVQLKVCHWSWDEEGKRVDTTCSYGCSVKIVNRAGDYCPVCGGVIDIEELNGKL